MLNIYCLESNYVWYHCLFLHVGKVFKWWGGYYDIVWFRTKILNINKKSQKILNLSINQALFKSCFSHVIINYRIYRRKHGFKGLVARLVANGKSDKDVNTIHNFSSLYKSNWISVRVSLWDSLFPNSSETTKPDML